MIKLFFVLPLSIFCSLQIRALPPFFLHHEPWARRNLLAILERNKSRFFALSFAMCFFLDSENQLQIVMVVYATAQLSHSNWLTDDDEKKKCLGICVRSPMDRLRERIEKWNYSSENENLHIILTASAAAAAQNLLFTRFGCLSGWWMPGCPVDKPVYRVFSQSPGFALSFEYVYSTHS